MTHRPNPEALTWTKSSFSDGGNNCVMVGTGANDVIGLRDSKAPAVPAIMIPTAVWSHFLGFIRSSNSPESPGMPVDDLFQ